MSMRTAVRTRALIAIVSTLAIGAAGAALVAQESRPGSAPPEFKLPDGWTMEDMQICVEAGTPGEMHAFLAKGAGVWAGKNTMWMGPDGEAMLSECVATTKPLMDGRYISCEIKGEMPGGMGAFNGLGIYGYDNVTQEFVSSWIDNHGTGILQGKGALSSDGKTLSWTYSYTCPITRKPATLREIEKITGADTRTLEMFGTDPKSGREYRMMKIDFTRKP